MNNKEFIAELSSRMGYTQQDTQKMVIAVMNELVSQVESNGSVVVPELGTFELKKRLERILTNPNTGKRMLVPPRLQMNFRATATLKDQLRKND